MSAALVARWAKRFKQLLASRLTYGVEGSILGLYRLVGLVVKVSASGAEDPGFESRLRRVFFRGESNR